MFRLAMVVLAAGSFVAEARAFAPAPFPRGRKVVKAEGNEANERKLRETIRQRRDGEITITLPLGAKWRLRRAVAEGLSVGFSIHGSGMTLSGAPDGWDVSGRIEGEVKLGLHFSDGKEKSTFTVIVRLVMVKQ